MLSAAEALDWGLISQVTPEGGAYEAALEIAVSFAAEVDPAAAAHAKRLITFGWGAPTQTARHMEYLADMSQLASGTLADNVGKFTKKKDR